MIKLEDIHRPEKSAKNRQNGLQPFTLAPGFKKELVASEPQVMDPVPFFPRLRLATIYEMM